MVRFIDVQRDLEYIDYRMHGEMSEQTARLKSKNSFAVQRIHPIQSEERGG